MFTTTSVPDLFAWWRNQYVRQISVGLDQACMVGDLYWNVGVAVARASSMLLLPVAEAKAEEKSAAVSPEQEVGLLHLIE
jgi:hypothetical protein